MAVPAQTALTYTFNVAPNNTLREDLEDFVYKISPMETPGMQAIGRKGNFKNVLHEWPVVELAVANPNNAAIEGNDTPNDAPTLGIRFANYTQIMTKTKGVSSTDEAVVGAGNIQKLAKQVLYGTQELKRDMEARLMGSGALVASTGVATSGARTTASLAAFIHTNVNRSGTAAVMSGPGGVGGYPSTAEIAGTARPLTETMFKGVIQQVWTQGGNPRYAFVPGSLKVLISTFTGNSTRFKRAEDKKLIAAIDVYESDFGQLQIVPDRFMDNGPTPPMRVLIIDPEYAEIGWLQGMKNQPLAKTGLSDRRLVSCEWGVIVGNEKAHGMVADVNLPP